MEVLGATLVCLNWGNIIKSIPPRTDVDFVGVIQTASLSLCGLAVILWMSIGTLSRTTGREMAAQRTIASMCLVSAVLLFAQHHAGGELWGSRNVARPFAVVAVIVALASMMNIKGKDVQGEANPHSIMRSRREEE